MSTTAAQDEYNALFRRSPTRRHRADSASTASDDGSTTLAPSTTTNTTKNKSIRSAKYTSSSRSSPFIRDRGDSSDEDASSGDEARAHQPTPYYLPRHYNSKANTGPKGVIADAQAFEAQKRVGSRTNGDAAYTRTQDMVVPRKQRAVRGQSRDKRGSASPYDEDEDDDEDDLEFSKEYRRSSDDNDDPGVREWRAKRIDELKALQQFSQESSPPWPAVTRPPDMHLAPSKRRQGRQTPLRYCGIERVDDMGYLTAVESAGRASTVVVFIFDDESDLSDAYAEHLATIAAKEDYSGSLRVIALHYETAEMDYAGIPALLAYRGGDLISKIVPLRDEVPFTCNVVTNLEEVMKEKGIL